MSRRLMRRDREHAYQGQGQGQAGTSLSLFEQVLALAQGRPVFTADSCAVVGGKVVAFIDWNDASHALTQGTSANQVATPVAHADFSGQLCATFVAHAYQSGRPAAQWQFASNGISCERVEVFTPTSGAGVNVISTTVMLALGAGSQLYYTGGGVFHHSVYTSAPGVKAVDQDFGAATINVMRYLSVRHKLADTPDYELRQNGALDASGAYLTPPTATTPEEPYTLGCNDFATVSNPAPMRWRAAAFFPALDVAGRATVDAWCAAGCPTL